MPVDRMRMCPWLEEQINSGAVKGLQWINKQKKIFQIPWMHAARHGWDLDKDAPLFMNWAIHTGKYHPGVDQPDPKTWKANFRCAMNSLPDIEEVKDKSIKKGSNAFKVYRMLTAAERAANKEKKKLEKQLNKAKKQILDTNTRCKGATEEEDKVEHEADSTVTIVNYDSADDQLMIHEMPDVCAVVEVTTEHEGVLDCQVPTKREGPPVSTSSTLYPRLQVSPISSCGESDAESEYSDDDSKEEWDMRCLSEPQTTFSVVRFPSCKPASKSSFFNSEKINFKVTSYQEESPMISYNVRPWCTPHLATKPVPTREHVGAHPRYSLPPQISLHLQGHNSSIEHPEDTQNVTSEIASPVHSHTGPQVATQTSINVPTQTISHMFAQRKPHLCVQPSPNLRPQITSLAHCGPLLRPSVTLQTSPHMPSPTGALASPHMLYPSGLHMHLQSRSPLHTKIKHQQPLHSSPHLSPHIRPSVYPLTTFHNYLHSSPQMSAQACPDPQKSSKMRVLTRPDINPHRNPGIMPRNSTQTGVHVPIMEKSHTSPFNPVSTRQSSPTERTCSTDGRASVIVNTGVKSQPFMTPQ